MKQLNINESLTPSPTKTIYTLNVIEIFNID